MTRRQPQVDGVLADAVRHELPSTDGSALRSRNPGKQPIEMIGRSPGLTPGDRPII